jgi:proteasome assembly chaperone (PAC2) family protein
MNDNPLDLIRYHHHAQLQDATLLLAFSGWMDGGDVSTGTVRRLVTVLNATPLAEIDPDPFYIQNVPGPMEIAALFRPHIEYEDGLIKQIQMPENQFSVDVTSNLVLFVGKEPHLRWRTFRDCLFAVCAELGIKKILFVGSFGGGVPHTREPRLHVSCSHADMLPAMEKYGVHRTTYSGPGSFVSYLLSQADAADLRMTSLVAEIPGYLTGANPASILAVTRRLATILGISPNLDELRGASTEWEMQVSTAVEQDGELAENVRQLEEEYDNQLLLQDEES